MNTRRSTWSSIRTASLAAGMILLGAGAVAGQDAPGAGGGADGDRAAQPLEGPWWGRAKEGPFGRYLFKTDLPREQATALAEHMNLLFGEYLERVGALRRRAPHELNVMMFATRADYEDTLRHRYGIDATGTGGMFFVNPRGTALAFWVEDLPRRRVEHVMQHEGFHQIAYALFGGDLPPWVNEGLAEYFGEGIVVGGNLVAGQSRPGVLDALRHAIETDARIPFRRLVTMTPEEWNANVAAGNAALQYQQAWSMVHFLIHGDGGRYRPLFERYLLHINNGLRSYDAWVRAFDGEHLDAFEAAWVEYVKQAQPSAFATALERIEFLAAGAHELASRGVAVASLEQLRDELQAIDFTLTKSQHGVSTVLRADDPALYSIPDDEMTAEAPVFLVEKSNEWNPDRRVRKLEEEHPTPPSIRTRGLRPHELGVVWARDAADPSVFRYEIETD